MQGSKATKTQMVRALRRGVMNSKLLSLDRLRLNNEFDPHWVPYMLGLVPHLKHKLLQGVEE